MIHLVGMRRSSLIIKLTSQLFESFVTFATLVDGFLNSRAFHKWDLIELTLEAMRTS